MNSAALWQVWDEVASVLESGSGWYLYALIDPCLGDPPMDPAWAQLETRTLKIKHPDIPADGLPYVIDATALSTLQRQKFVEYFLAQAKDDACRKLPLGAARPRRTCAILATPYAPAELVGLLARAATLNDPKGVRRILRYWDPRVLQHLVVKEGVLDLERLLPNWNGHWWFVDSQGHPVHHVQLVRMSAGRESGLMITDHEQAWLTEVSELNACYARTGSQELGNQGVWGELKVCLKVARELGLTGDDRIFFAATRYALRAPIEHAERIRQLIGDMRQHGLRYSTLEAELDDRDWAEIAAQAKQAVGKSQETWQ